MTSTLTQSEIIEQGAQGGFSLEVINAALEEIVRGGDGDGYWSRRGARALLSAIERDRNPVAEEAPCSPRFRKIA